MILDDTTAWIIAATALVLWLPQNAQHEGAHCVAHEIVGDEIVGFWPFPGRLPDGSFAFAHMSYRRTGTYGSFLEGLCACAPQLVNTLLLFLLLPFHAATLDPLIQSLLCGWALVNYVDGAFNLATFYRPAPKLSTDGWRTAAAWGGSPWFYRAVAATWHLGMGVHVAALT